MQLLICAGGTGGGVYPALAVLTAMENKAKAVLWVGSQGGMEAGLVQRAGIPFAAIPAAGVHGVGLARLPRNLWRLGQGVIASRRILRKFRPDVILFTGGYVAAPLAVAAQSIPKVLYVPDIEPGMALKFLSRFATRIAITANDSRKYFPANVNHKIQVSGYPTRPDLAKWDQTSARQALSLTQEYPVLLFLGGSKGAHSINHALLSILPRLLDRFQVIHVSGQADWEEIQNTTASLSDDHKTRYHAFPYLHEEIGTALASADLVISRAGASTLGEYPLFGLPAMLVPYPHAWRYQKINADYLVQHGAATILPDEQLGAQLLTATQELFAQPQQLESMRRAMQSLAAPHAAKNIANLLIQVAGKTTAGGGEI